MRSAALVGINPERFWQLTPVEIGIEVEAQAKRQEKEDYRTGLICSVIYNMHRDSKKSKPMVPEDFMPAISDKKKPEPVKQQTWQEIKSRLQATFK